MYPIGPKSGWSKQAHDIACGKIKISPDELPMLLQWLKDFNWPGALDIGNYLLSRSMEIIRPVQNILRSSDYIWIYWILLVLVNKFPSEACAQLKNDLLSLAFGFDPEGAHIIAMEICIRHKFEEKNIFLNLIKKKIQLDINNKKEYEILMSLLNV